MSAILKENISETTIQRKLAELKESIQKLSIEGVDLAYVESVINTLTQSEFAIYDSKINTITTNNVDLTAKYNLVKNLLTNLTDKVERINIDEVEASIVV